MKRINVPYQLHEQETYVNIPVTYETELDGRREVFKCAIALPEDQIPEWLGLRTFEIVKVHGEGCTSTHYSENGPFRNVDTALFITHVGDAIHVAETFKNSSR